jgi:hypothetical protein
MRRRWIPSVRSAGASIRRHGSRARGTNRILREFSPDEGLAMPIWMEILLNVIGYAGFIAIATMNPCADEAAARQAPGPNAVN